MRRGNRYCLIFRYNRSDKLQTPAGDSLDDRLLLAGVADCRSGRIGARADRAFGYDTTIPDFIDDLVAGHQHARIADQQMEQIKHLGLGFHGLAIPEKQVPVSVENTVEEGVPHGLIRYRFTCVLKKIDRPGANLEKITRLSQGRLQAGCDR